MNRIYNYFKQLSEKEVTKFLVVFYLVGLSGFLIPATRKLFEFLIPISLLINVSLMFLFHRNFNRKHLVFFGVVVLGTFCIEAIGVNTRILFGEYMYGSSLPLKAFGTPLIIGVNWLMLSYGAVQIVRSIAVFKKYVPLLVGVLMTAFDFIMEPVAMKTGMWTWVYNTIPHQNYLMWFIVSVVLGSMYELFNIETNNKIAVKIFLFQLVFFVGLNVFLK